MVTAEPTSGAVWHASRGAITLLVEVQGRAAHVGQAHLGVNAFEQMVQIAEPLAVARARAARAAHGVPGRERGGARARCWSWAGRRAAERASTSCRASAWFSVDRRFNPEERLDEELARLTTTIEAAAGRAGAEVRVEVLQEQPSAATDADAPRGAGAGALCRGGRGRGAALRAVPGRPRHALVRAARHSRVRLRRRAARRVARPGRVHRRGGDAPLRRGLRAVRRHVAGLRSG